MIDTTDGCIVCGKYVPSTHDEVTCHDECDARGEIQRLRACVESLTREREEWKLGMVKLANTIKETATLVANSNVFKERDEARAELERVKGERDAIKEDAAAAVAIYETGVRDLSSKLDAALARVAELSADHMRFGCTELPCSRELAESARVFHAEAVKMQARVAELEGLAVVYREERAAADRLYDACSKERDALAAALREIRERLTSGDHGDLICIIDAPLGGKGGGE